MEYVIFGIIIGAIIGGLVYLAQKDNKRGEEYVSALTNEQKEKLRATEIEPVTGKNNVWTQVGMICDVKIKNENKVALVVLWHNKVIQNDTFDKIQHADINMKKSDFDSHGLKNGDFVKIYIDPEKSAKIIFE